MDIVESIVKVFAIGLLFGAGLPALFAVGMLLESRGAGGTTADGTTTAPNPALRAIGYFFFAIVLIAIIIGLLWVARTTLQYYFGIQVFPDWAYKK
ncbi:MULTISPECIES: hypothetical protein [unclassified Gordonia (in: high G+C Gram-positive bacteria)]